MKKNDLIDALAELGLHKNEAAVYLASLSIGPNSIKEIAREALLKRTTVYTITESLIKNGLMSKQILGLKNVFVAENPDRLERIIEFQRGKLKKIFPELEAVRYLGANESFIKYYEGAKGFRTVYDSILTELKAGDEYLIMSNVATVMGIDEEYLTEFTRKREELPIKIRTILKDDDYARNYAQNRSQGNQQIKFFPKSTNLTANLIVLPNKVIITQTIDPIMTIVIENKSVVQIHREQFNIIWNSIQE